MLLTPCILVYSVHWPTNAINKMQRYTNHKTQFICITPTSFGTELPSSRSLRTQRITSLTLDFSQVLNIVTVIFKILKWWKSRIHNFAYIGNVTWQSGDETCRGDTHQELCSRICKLFYCTSMLVIIQDATMQNESAFSASHLRIKSNYHLHSRNHV
jgi:hypothetical protein